MADKTPNLDDLRFQKDLVDVARKRIQDYCPEWTEYNLSDPGVTLIELFAWMAENIIYRLNRVPEKNYLKFLEMTGVNPMPAHSASAELTFYLSVPIPIAPGEALTVRIPQGLEVNTSPTEDEEGITFTVDKEVLIAPPPVLTDLRTSYDNMERNYFPRLSKGGAEEISVFNEIPDAGDAFYLGFADSQDMAGYLLQLTFDCREAQAVGGRLDNPPWMWECSLGEDQWERVPISTRRGEEDTTGGLNYAHGSLILQLPLSMRPDRVGGVRGFWLKCRLITPDEEHPMYRRTPRVKFIEAHTLGAVALASQASVVRLEQLGTSSGEAGQTFRVQHYPILGLAPGEDVVVEEKQEDEFTFVPWTRVADFADSDRFDRHYVLDEASGEVQFGPAVRQPNGSVQQYGRIPDAGLKIRISQYRYGGGSKGNVPVGKIHLLRSAVPFVDRVTNFQPATGGRDRESLEEVKLRARRELRSQRRAVTAEDFETLGKAARPEKIARVKCIGGDTAAGGIPGVVDLLVVPAGSKFILANDLSSLVVTPELKTEIYTHLSQFRLLTTTLRILEPSYVGVKVKAEIAVDKPSQEKIVRERVNRVLKLYLSPFPLEKAELDLLKKEDLKSASEEDVQDEWLKPEWQGWPFGRMLYVSELYAFIQKIRGVIHVLSVQLSSQEAAQPKSREDSDEVQVSGAETSPVLIPVFDGKLQVPAGATLCSFEHEIQVFRP